MLSLRIGLACLLLAGAAHATDITTCHQNISSGDVATLQVDLSCDSSSPNVNLRAGARLELNGHSISGGYLGVGVDPGTRRTVIEGPGEIFGATGAGPIYGCGISTQSKTVVRNVHVHDNACGIVAVYAFSLRLQDVTVSNNSADGVTYAIPVKTGRVHAERVTVTGNGGNGIVANRGLVLIDATVTGNGVAGAVANTKISTHSSTLTGNGPGGDVASFLKPHLVDTTCEHSVDRNTAGTWGVCSLD
jgi:hypothetical protein